MVYLSKSVVYSAAMLSRKIRQIVILLSAVMLMSSQYSVASYVCTNMSTTDMLAMDMSAECMREMKTAASPLCKQHCDQTPQSSEVPSVTFAPFMVQFQWSLVFLDAFKLVHRYARHHR